MTDNIMLSTSENDILASLSKRDSDMKATLKAWSEVNSGSWNREGLAEMRSLLRSAFTVLPGEVRDYTLPPFEKVANDGTTTQIELEPSLEVCVRPKAETQLVLTGHYDTVFPKDFHFQSVTEIDSDTWNGPGLADMKGGILVMCEALKAFEAHSDAKRIGYTVLLSPDEEIGSPGSASRLAELGKAAHVGLTYEPALADGSLAGARKGSGNFSVIFKGRAAHAGREHHLGCNAMAAAARFSAAIDALNGRREGVTFNVAKIDGGGANNIVPELAIVRFNVRMVDISDLDWITSGIDAAIAQANCERGIHAHRHGGFSRPPKPMAPANATVFNWVKQAGNALGQTIKWAPSGGVCEGNNLYASGCPNVDTLGVRGGDIHSDREFLKLSSLVERAQLSALILIKIADGTFDARTAKSLAQAEIS